MFNKSRAWTSKLAFLIYYNDYIIMINGSINSHWDIITRDANVSHSQQNFILFTTLRAMWYQKNNFQNVFFLKHMTCNCQKRNELGHIKKELLNDFQNPKHIGPQNIKVQFHPWVNCTNLVLSFSLSLLFFAKWFQS